MVPKPLVNCRSRCCPRYGELWAGDTRRKLFANLIEYGEAMADRGRENAAVSMLTVTAPGCDRLPWAEDCSALGDHRHSGLIGCRVEVDAAARWNEAARIRWTEMHRSVMAWCRRRGLRPWVLSRVWEKQHRGVLHVHPVMAYTTTQQKLGADAYRARLQEVATDYDFGFIDRKRDLRHPRAAAAYLSAYFVTGKRGKMSLQESARSGQMPRSIVYVHGRLTRASGVTMRTLRKRRHTYVLVDQLRRCLEGQGVPDDVTTAYIEHKIFGAPLLL